MAGFLERHGITKATLLAAGVALLPAFQMGFAIGAPNPLGPQIVASLGLSATNPLSWPLLIAIFNPAAIVGTMVASRLTVRLGRRLLLLGSSVLYVVAGLCFVLSSPASQQHLGQASENGPEAVAPLVDTGGELSPHGFAASTASSSSVLFCLFLVGRVLVGVASGGATVVVPAYLDEISPPEVRGLFGVSFQLLITVGILMGQLPALLYPASHDLWPVVLGFTATMGVAQLALAPLFLVESPVWLFTRGNEREAITALRRLVMRDSAAVTALLDVEGGGGSGRGAGGAESGALERRVEALRDACSRVDEKGSGEVSDLASMWADPSLRLPAIIVTSLLVAQSLSGINAVFYYSTDLFQSAGMDSPVFCTVLVAFVNLLATVAVLPLVETLGRRPLVLMGSGGMMVASLVLCASLSVLDAGGRVAEEGGGGDVARGAAAFVSVTAILLFVSFFEAGLGAIPWQIGNEILPPHVKVPPTLVKTLASRISPILTSSSSQDAVLGPAVGANWFANFLVGIAFPSVQNILGYLSFIPFALILAATFVVMYLLLPETRGRSASELVHLINKRRSLHTSRLFLGKRDD